MEIELEASQSGSSFISSLARQETGWISVPVLGKSPHTSSRAAAGAGCCNKAFTN